MKTNANTPINLPLSLNSSQGFIMNNKDLSVTGSQVCGAGDVNGDGIDDLIIGVTSTPRSKVYVFYGRKNTPAQINVSSTNWDLTQGFMIKGNASQFDSLGTSVASAGDVNGDGIGDVIIGAPNASPDGRDSAGIAYVIYGQKNGFTAHIDLNTTLDLTKGFMIKGGALDDKFGSSVSAAGDVNGDGIGDVIIGAPNADPNGHSSAGIAYVIYGKNNSLIPHIDLKTTLDLARGFMMKGNAPSDTFGEQVRDAGDVNGDGIGDVIIGASGASPDERSSAGIAYVIFGKKNGPTAHIDLSTTLNLTLGFMIKGGSDLNLLGQAVSAAGDMNADGIGDIIVSSNGANNYAGLAHVIYGRKDGFTAHIDLKETLDLSQGFMITGNASNDGFGISMSKGDFNGDGISDVIVGAPTASPNGHTHAGLAYVIYGKKDGLTDNIDLKKTLDLSQGFMIQDSHQENMLGNLVSSAGDMNDDGIEDFIFNAGVVKVYVMYSTCDLGYYFSSNGKCIECPHCNLCTITGCQDCKSGFSLYNPNGKCYATGACPSGTYESNAKCLNCSTTNCDKCTNTDCQACKNGFSLYNKDGKCYATGNCPARTYENNSKCIDCSDANCDVCTINGCQTCKNGFSLYSKDGKCYATGNCPTRTYENNSKCIDCSDANCNVCTINGCQTCKNGFSLYSKDGKCYATGNCPPRTYENNSKCIDCSDANCDVCTINGCQTCQNGFSLYSKDGKCYATGACPPGTYEKNAQCLDCSTPNCAKCTNLECHACKNGFYFYTSTGKCYADETCPPRTYQDNGKCIDCSDANCDICTNAGCQTCKDGYVLDTTQRTCSACPLGTYESDNKCLDCSDPNCNKCTDTECQACKKGYFLDSEEGKCSSESDDLVNNSIVTVNESASDSTFFTPSTIVAIALPVVEGIAIVFLAIQLIKLRTALMRRRPIRIEPLSTQVSPTPRLSTKSVNYYPSPRLSTKSGNYSPTNGA